jgi:predicted PurR-regulated permease PerM
VASPASARTFEQNASLVLRLALVVLFVWIARALVIPIVMGALFAILLQPLVAKLNKRFKRLKGWSPLIVTLGGLVLVVMPLLLIVTQAFFTVNELVEGDFVGSAADALSALGNKATSWGRQLNLGTQNTRDLVAQAKPKIAGTVAAFLSMTVSAFPGYIIELFLFVLSLYYLLRDGPRLVAWVKSVLPFSSRATDDLVGAIDDTVHGALLGTMAVAIVQGGLTLISLLVLGIPGAFLWGVIATAFSFVPMFGTAPVTGGVVIYLWTQGRTTEAVVMAVIAVVIGLSDNVIQPLIQSSRSKMHPLLALLSIFGGLQLFGPFGVFIGPVSAAMAVWAVRSFRAAPKRPTEVTAA